MKIFQNKIVAILLCIIMIASTLIFLSPKGLKKEMQDVQTLFFEGENGEELDSAYYNLKKRSENAKELNSLYIRYFGEDETSRAVNEVTGALEDATNMSKAVKDNKDLTSLCSKEYERLSTSSQYPSFEKDLNRLKANLDGFNDILSRLKFNDAAKEFDSLISSFPASFIASLGSLEAIGTF